MKQTPTFIEPVLRSTQSKVDTELYERSLERYDEGAYLEAFHLLLDHLDPGFRSRYGNADGSEFHIPHGSILVDIHLGDRIRIAADFLELPEKGRVAMLRQIADLGLNRLLLPRFRKRGDRLSMEYECALSQSHPHKIYHVLRNICHTGDRYDDEFCTKFGARRCYEPCVTPYSDGEIDRIREALQRLCRETLEAVADYDSDRRYGYSWNVLDTALYRIYYIAHPQGQLMNDLEKAIDDMDRDLPVAELVARGKSFLERVLALSREELARDLYFVDTLVSTRLRSSLNNVQENMKDVYKEATEAIQAGNPERAAVRILYKFYEMYYYNDVHDDLNRVAEQALRRSAGKPMPEAAEILYEALEKIMDGDLDPDSGSDEAENSAAGYEMAADLAQEAQQAADAMQKQVAEMQARMQEVLERGDMAEYMRMAAEFQQQLMQQAMNRFTDKN